MKFLAVVLSVFVFATAAYAAPFSDVPRTHWAYDAIQKAVDAGILQGYDGKFEGQRLLNRYQMAVVVAKLLDAVKAAPAGTTGAPADLKKTVANLEALTIEFADELALLNVKVSTLEGSFQELTQQVAAGTGHKAMDTAAGGQGFTAFASFALLNTDKSSGMAGNGLVDGPVLASDSTYFDMPQVSLGVDREVNPGVFFHAQFDFDAYVNGAWGGVQVNEAYFFVDELFGDIGGKVGAFALPFSMEHNGPFRTCNYTITPSILNTIVELNRVYGLEFQRTKDVKPGDIGFKFGFGSGTDFGPMGLMGAYSTIPVAVGRGEGDDAFGFYVMVDKKATEKNAFGWNLGYFDNGGDYNAGSDGIHQNSLEFDMFNVGLQWSNDDLLVMAQYMDCTMSVGPGMDIDLTAWYLLVNFKIDEKQSVSLRYDVVSEDMLGVDVGDFSGITFAYNRKVTENSMFQLEYITPDNGDSLIEPVDIDDDLFQIRYKVHF